MEEIVTSGPMERVPAYPIADHRDKTYCVFCGAEIKLMIYKGTGVCGEKHNKLRRMNEKGINR